MNNLEIKVAEETDFDNVYELLKTEYTNNPFFELIDDGFLKETNSDRTKILIAKENGNIISTMRGTLIKNIQELEQFMYNLPSEKLLFPTLFLTRAATQVGIKQKGINSLLRYNFIIKGLQENVESLSGFVSKNMPRVHLITRLGYCSEEMESKYRSLRYYDNISLFVYLKSEKFSSAKTLLEKELNKLAELKITNQSKFLYR